MQRSRQAGAGEAIPAGSVTGCVMFRDAESGHFSWYTVEVTTGASSDFQQATNIARHMVMKWGMSEATGLVSYDGGGDISAESKRKIDAEIRRLLTEAYERAKTILQRHEKDLHTLAHELLTKETLSGAQIKALVGSGQTSTS